MVDGFLFWFFWSDYLADRTQILRKFQIHGKEVRRMMMMKVDLKDEEMLLLRFTG